MAASIDLTETQVFTVLRSFILSVIPSIECIRGQVNRVAEPVGTDYIVMWPLFRERLKWNESSYNDVAFVGSISGADLTVTQILTGIIATGQFISGQGIAANTSITGQVSGTPGGIGVYTITPTPQTVASTTIQAGTESVQQGTKMTIQVDVHGPASGENAQILSTLMRDDIACQFFVDAGYNMAPLYAGDPHQAPFINGEQQFEEKWTFDAVLQINPNVTVSQQFAANVAIGLIEVYEAYPG